MKYQKRWISGKGWVKTNIPVPKIDTSFDIEKITKLANLSLTEEEKVKFNKERKDAIKHVQRIQEVATD